MMKILVKMRYLTPLFVLLVSVLSLRGQGPCVSRPATPSSCSCGPNAVHVPAQCTITVNPVTNAQCGGPYCESCTVVCNSSAAKVTAPAATRTAPPTTPSNPPLKQGELDAHSTEFKESLNYPAGDADLEVIHKVQLGNLMKSGEYLSSFAETANRAVLFFATLKGASRMMVSSDFKTWTEVAGAPRLGGPIVASRDVFVLFGDEGISSRPGIFLSDNGEIWKRILSPGDSDCGFVTLVVDGEAIYVVLNCGTPPKPTLKVSMDQGSSWQDQSLPGPVVSPYSPQFVASGGRLICARVVGVSGSSPYMSIFLSKDHGKTWFLTGPDEMFATFSVIADGERILVRESLPAQGNAEQLFESNDGGNSWKQLMTPVHGGTPLLLTSNQVGILAGSVVFGQTIKRSTRLLRSK